MRRGQVGTALIRTLKGVVALDKDLLDRFVLRNHERTVAWARVLRLRKPQL